MIIQGEKYPSDFEAKKQMIEIGKLMSERSYVGQGEGSLSIRTGPNAIWITERQADLACMSQNTFIRVDRLGKQQIGTQDRQLPEDTDIHLRVYQDNDRLRSVIHSYPIEVIRLAMSGRGAEQAAFSPAIRALGRIQLLDDPGVSVEKAGLVCRTENGLMIKDNGCVMWGESLIDAYRLTEALCRYQRITGGCECGSCCRRFAQVSAETAKIGNGSGGTHEKLMTTPADMEGVTGIYKPEAVRDDGPVYSNTSGIRREAMDEVILRILNEMQGK